MPIQILDVGYALWFIFPAYCANAIPVIFGGGPAMDFGRKFVDGKPILGSHKTFRGFLSGLLVGTLVGFLQSLLFQHVLSEYNGNLRYSVLLGFALSLGAMTGDLCGSFIKRRLDLPPGSALPLADELDFVVGAVLFSFFVSPPPSWVITLLIFVITAPLHFLTNQFAALVGLKKKTTGLR